MKNEILQNHDQVFAKTVRFSQSLLAVSVAMVAATQQVSAQPIAAAKSSSAFEEVVVTAQRRSEEALDVPITITAIGAEQLGNNNVEQLSDIQKLTPALRFENSAANSQPTIRGVGTSVVVAGGSSNVGIYIDGFYSPNPMAADFDLMNVQSVQVLKGPQGTLFGRNSTGGAILITTKDPSTKESADIEVSYGNYNTQRYQLYATGGLNEKLAFDVAGLLRKSDGFVDNINTGSDSDGEYNNSSVRLGIKLDATDKISALLHYAYSDKEDNTFLAYNAYEDKGRTFATAATYGATVATEPDEVSNNYTPQFKGIASATQLTVKADLDYALLTSYTQYRDERSGHHLDFDMSAMNIYHYFFDNIDKTLTQEFLLSSSGDNRLQWTTGLFYFDHESTYENNSGSVAGAPFYKIGGSSVTVNTIAAYGDLTYALRDDLFLTAGLRYSKDHNSDAYFLKPPAPGNENLVQTNVPDLDDSQVAPRLVLRYKPDVNSSMYVSYTEGYKSAILNVGGGSLDGIEIDPENMKAYEVGYKFSTDTIMLDLSAYYYDYKDLQVASYVGSSSQIKNAATSNIYGFDGQVRYAFSEQWEANLGLAYLHTEYDQFDQSQTWTQCLDASACGTSYGIFIPAFADASGNEMQNAPKLTSTLGVTYRADLAGGSLIASGTLYHTADFYFDSSNAYQQDAYNLLSARAQWTDPSDRYTIGIFGDNLTDEEYRTQVLPQFYGALSTWGAPRTYGVSLGLHF